MKQSDKYKDSVHLYESGKSISGVAPPPMKDGRTAIQAHHHDYSKPYEVTWLCQKCHHELHKNQYLAMKEVPQEVRPTLVSAGFP